LFFRVAPNGAEGVALSVAIGLAAIGALVSLMRLARTEPARTLATGPGTL
jgi:galactitol-specific phosphotransferase system IIC component